MNQEESMSDRAARPRRVQHSEKLDRLNRLRWDFAVVPYAFNDDKWDRMRVAAAPSFQKQSQEQQHKRMIKEVETGVKGLNFPAEEMAKIIRGWMADE